MKSPRKGLTLVELLVVTGIIGILGAVTLPVLSRARAKYHHLQCANGIRQITLTLNVFAADHGDKYPPSVARVHNYLFSSFWSWDEPMAMIAYWDLKPLSPHRALSEFLGPYVDDPRQMYCPLTPKEYPYLDQAWEDGDAWKCPDPPYNGKIKTPHYGSYNFYWGYTGYLDGQKVFRGPTGLATKRRQSTLLVSDMLVYDNWRAPGSFVSGHKFKQGSILPRHALSCDYWYSLQAEESKLNKLKGSLNAGFTDGHVETYFFSDTTAMGVANHPDGLTKNKYLGNFYIPESALR